MEELPYRKNIRLKNYDYSQNGCYFITISTYKRQSLFGKFIVGSDLVSARIELNSAGHMIGDVYRKIVYQYNNMVLDEYIVMPDHFHCILNMRADTRSAPTPINEIVQAFKSRSTIEYIHGVKSGYYPTFDDKIWQRNYYEHIIRNHDDYENIRRYIIENPIKSENDY